MKMNFIQEKLPFEYRHKKFDVKRQIVNSVTSQRKRSWSFGSECSSEMSSETESIEIPLIKRTKFMDEQPLHYRALSAAAASTTAPISPIPMPVKLPTKTLAKLPKIKEETFARIYKYHGNMVRQFPQKQRTARDQERRDKNTLACRQSRFIKKLHCVVIEEKYKDFTQQYQNIVEESMRTGLYMQQLKKLAANSNNSNKTQPPLKQEASAPANSPAAVKKLFTIAYLLKSH